MRASNLALAHPRRREVHREQITPEARRCRRKFLRFFPGGFQDETYLAWERDYKWNANREWEPHAESGCLLSIAARRRLCRGCIARGKDRSADQPDFSFEKMALRDAVKSGAGARMFATGLYDFLHGKGRMQERFERWCDVVVRFAAQTDARSYVAHCDGIRLSGAAGNTHLP